MRSFSDMWYDPVARKKILIYGGGGLVFIIILIIIIAVATSGKKAEFHGRDVLNDVPLIDGHNNLPQNLFLLENNLLKNFNFTTGNADKNPWVNVSHTSLPKLRTGRVAGQFWVAHVECEANNVDAVARALEQIDVIKRLIDEYDELEFVTTADGIWQSLWNGKIASLIGVEGGHAIDSRMAVLRMFYDLGVRYMTLTHDCETPWSEHRVVANNTATPGLTPFGKDVIREMNRLGMMVDISHTSEQVMLDAIETSSQPVIFSHSSAFKLTNNTLNIGEDVIKKLNAKGGVIMINFGSIYVKIPDENDPTNTTASMKDVIAHLNYIRDITSSRAVGIGANFGEPIEFPEDLQDVQRYPELFDELALNGWGREDLENLAGRNLLRVMKAVEEYSQKLKADKKDIIYEEAIPTEDLDQLRFCRSNLTEAT